jgi:hypothetical protein
MTGRDGIEINSVGDNKKLPDLAKNPPSKAPTGHRRADSTTPVMLES